MKPIRRLLYIGSMQTASDCAANRWCSEAMNVTQLEMMRAFQACGVDEVIGLSFPGTPSRGTSGILRRSKCVLLDTGLTIWEQPFLALGILQVISQAAVLSWRLLQMGFRNRPDAILITNPLARLAVPSLLFAHLWGVPSAVFATDHNPVHTSNHPLRRIQHWLETQVVRYAPGLVVYSSYLARDLRAHRRWIRVSRPPATDLLDLKRTAQPGAKIVYYAGTTSRWAGADMLLEATQHLTDPAYQFWFSGRGELDEAIQVAAQRDPRITHWGFVDRSKYLDLLAQAHVLINPRPSHRPENRYNFPSKLMEYMAVGAPIISTATADVTEYYQNGLIILKEEDQQRLGATIEQVFSLTDAEREQLGQRAKALVEHETWIGQARRVLDFMSS